ncbi:unnamed protein product, partial [Symbiodinium necroappetens]
MRAVRTGASGSPQHPGTSLMAAMAASGKSSMDLSCRTVEAMLETAWAGASGSRKTHGSTPPNVVAAQDEIDRWDRTVAGQRMERREFASTGADGSRMHLGSTLRAATAAPVDPPCGRTVQSLLDRAAPPGVSTCRLHPSSTPPNAEDALRVAADLPPCQLPHQQPPADVLAGVVGCRLRRTSTHPSAVDVLRVQAAHPPLRSLLDASHMLAPVGPPASQASPRKFQPAFFSSPVMTECCPRAASSAGPLATGCPPSTSLTSLCWCSAPELCTTRPASCPASED